MRKNKYDIAIFDMDGTLTNTEEAIAYCCNTTLRHFELEEKPTKEIIKNVGYGLKNLIIDLLPEDKKTDRRLIEELLKYGAVVYQKNADYKVELYSGISDVLSKCVENGIKIAISTNKIQAPADKIVQKLMNKWEFTHVVGDDLEHPLKPDPYSINLILNDLGIAKSRAIYIGDSESDINTAKNAGIEVIGVDWGFRGADNLKKAGADYIAYTAGDILEILF